MTTLPATNVERVAAQLEGDMRSRGLRPGDRYLTAAEASSLFDINSMTMHRAMSTLADRELLVRHRSRGTFVGPAFGRSDFIQHEFDVLHIVMAMDYHRSQTFTSDELVDEFAKSLPGATIQVHHVIDGADQRHVEQLIAKSSQGESSREGFVLIRCSREVQLCVASSRFPAVVFGQSYPGVPLPCLTHAQDLVGQLMAEYCLRHGAERYAIVTHANWRYGDHRMIDGINSTLGSAGVQLESVRIRSLQPQRELVAQAVEEMLIESDFPQAFICRGDFYASIVTETVASHKHRFSVMPCVVSGGHAPPPSPPAPYARVMSSMTLREQVDKVVGMLNSSAGDREMPRQHPGFVVPIQFYEPHSSEANP